MTIISYYLLLNTVRKPLFALVSKFIKNRFSAFFSVFTSSFFIWIKTLHWNCLFALDQILCMSSKHSLSAQWHTFWILLSVLWECCHLVFWPAVLRPQTGGAEGLYFQKTGIAKSNAISFSLVFLVKMCNISLRLMTFCLG